jgi:aminoglycoside phosphotransferase (APT) family kinase protein
VSDLGPPFASGRSADVYALDGDWVLRRYRDGRDTAPEADLMAHVAAHGYPVPEIRGADGPDLVMRRLEGPTMLGAFSAGTLALDAGARTLADLHTRLHAIPPPPAASPGTRIVHRDLHPDNVMLTPDGPYVIDWRDAVYGPPDLDLASTALILAEVAVDPDQPLAAAARELLGAFLAHAGGHPTDQLDTAAAIRTTNPTLSPAEVSRLGDATALVVYSARGVRDLS